ncbi:MULTISPECIES: amino acid ABC transporter permease [unclassified Rhizobium]|uniref:amino acid ABC transporter permease n=1 Tax=unclassified Rhizobium TaxID=2613769 RepID=UPI0007143025|nr:MULTISPECIES: amino acid ABC transporter permease [unclassified Rhizobium]KQT03960.1 amino acid ABC transporter permease [Rhizobium sp. Leaf386]KQT95578.1 amino acid ABC transporter permease [Rhizobium sp. Leaf453]
MAVLGLSDGERHRASSILYNPEYRSYFFQVLTVLVVVWLIYQAWSNAAENLARSNMTAGFGFLSARAGFDLGQSLIEYTSDSTYRRALLVGFLNTLLVGFFGIITATIVGLLVGVGRLSNNWLIARLCTVYVEIFRNIPPLLVIFFWYKGVLAILPDFKQIRQSVQDAKAADPSVVDPSFIISNRGINFPNPIFEPGFNAVWLTLAIGIVASIAFSIWANRQQMSTGKRPPVLLVSLGLIVVLPLLVFLVVGAPISFDYPVLGRFNLSGGGHISPEFLSLYLALSLYTASFIAEIVRAGIRGVPKGQSEAANALGIRPSRSMRLIVLPQALRIIIPPLTSQYLNLIKNSSLAVAAGYADLVQVGNTILNQSGHSIEIIAIWMIVYLTISLTTSLFMNWFNAKMALVER